MASEEMAAKEQVCHSSKAWYLITLPRTYMQAQIASTWLNGRQNVI